MTKSHNQRLKEAELTGSVAGGIGGGLVGLGLGDVFTIPAGAALGAVAGREVILEVVPVIEQARKEIKSSSKLAAKHLKGIQRDIGRLHRKHGKKNENLASYLMAWRKLIDKRLEMGQRDFNRFMRWRAKEHKKAFKAMRRREEKML